MVQDPIVFGGGEVPFAEGRRGLLVPTSSIQDADRDAMVIGFFAVLRSALHVTLLKSCLLRSVLFDDRAEENGIDSKKLSANPEQLRLETWQ